MLIQIFKEKFESLQLFIFEFYLNNKIDFVEDFV